MTTTVLAYVGIIVLGLLSIQDYHDKVVKQGKVGLYYLCMLLFVALNIIIYLVICSQTMGVDFAQLFLARARNVAVDKQAFPLILALAYFGVGTVNIPLGDKVVSIYGLLLKLFQGMYRPEGVDIDPIRERINSLNEQSDRLETAIKHFNETATAAEHRWNAIDEKWRDLEEDKRSLEAQNDAFVAVQQILSGTRLSKADIARLVKELDERRGRIMNEINERLRNHVCSLATANEKDPIALQNLLKEIGLRLPEVPPPSHKLPLCRAIVCSLFGGFILAGILGLMGTSHGRHAEPILTIVPVMLSLGIFSIPFSYIATLKQNDYHWAIVLGGVAGILGYGAFAVSTYLLGALGHYDVRETSTIVRIVANGAILGASQALFNHVFRFSIYPRIRNMVPDPIWNHVWGYLSMAVLGALLWNVITSLTSFSLSQNFGIIAVTGALIAVIASFSASVFYKEPAS
jgi:hypothetical protein